MNPESSEYLVRGARGGSKWYVSTGFNAEGSGVGLNVIADSGEEADAICQGLGIALDMSFHKTAEYIASADKYPGFNQP